MTLHQLEIETYLGWGEQERSQPQKIRVDIRLGFTIPPLACRNDELADTICYHRLITQLKQYLANRSFRLIEYLGREIYQFIKSTHPQQLVSIRVHKHPPMADIIEGVSFHYGDEDNPW